jgi:hypothetical protein
VKRVGPPSQQVPARLLIDVMPSAQRSDHSDDDREEVGMGVRAVNTPKVPDRKRGARDLAQLRSLSAVRRVRDDTSAIGHDRSLNLSIQEIRLITSFRGLPDDERRTSVLQALEAFSNAYI